MHFGFTFFDGDARSRVARSHFRVNSRPFPCLFLWFVILRVARNGGEDEGDEEDDDNDDDDMMTRMMMTRMLMIMMITMTTWK